jgi:predicted O-methyltransferase YrrM
MGTVARTLSEADGIPRRVVTFDHMAEYADATRDLLRLHGLTNTVDVICAPIEGADAAAPGTAGTYARAQLQEHAPAPVDLLFVDGPPWSQGSAGGRCEAVLAIADRLAPDAVVIFDDARRDREVISRTASSLKAHAPQYIDTVKGTAVIRLGLRNACVRPAVGESG